MSLVYVDRVKENVPVTGTADVSLGGPVSGFQTWSAALAIGELATYVIADNVAGAWEIGVGTYLSGNKLQRTTVLFSSAGEGVKVFFAGNVCDVFLDAVSNVFNGSPFLSQDGGTIDGDLTVTGNLIVEGGILDLPYIYRAYFPGTYTSSQVLDVGKLGVDVVFASALPGASIGCSIAPTADVLVHILKNATIEATGTILASATGGTLTSAGWTQTASAAWQVVAPGTADATLAGLFLTVLGTR